MHTLNDNSASAVIDSQEDNLRGTRIVVNKIKTRKILFCRNEPVHL